MSGTFAMVELPVNTICERVLVLLRVGIFSYKIRASGDAMLEGRDRVFVELVHFAL